MRYTLPDHAARATTVERTSRCLRKHGQGGTPRGSGVRKPQLARAPRGVDVVERNVWEMARLHTASACTGVTPKPARHGSAHCTPFSESLRRVAAF